MGTCAPFFFSSNCISARLPLLKIKISGKSWAFTKYDFCSQVWIYDENMTAILYTLWVISLMHCLKLCFSKKFQLNGAPKIIWCTCTSCVVSYSIPFLLSRSLLVCNWRMIIFRMIDLLQLSLHKVLFL